MSETETIERPSLLDAFAESANGPLAVINQPVDLSAPVTQNVGARPVAKERNEKKILQTLSTLASVAGEDWYYRFPVKKKVKDPQTGKESWVQDFIEGPSIKCCNAVARLYGNCDVDCRVVDFGDSILFYARFVDIETGYSLTRPFQQRRTQKTMNTDAGRAGDIVFQIGASKAIRNVVNNALETFTSFAMEEAKKSLVTAIGRQLEGWRARTLEIFKSEMKIDIKRVERTAGRPAKNWLATDIARIYAEVQAVRDGMATIEETWPVFEGDETGTDDAPTNDAPAAEEKKAATDAAGKDPKANPKKSAAKKPDPKKEADDKPTRDAVISEHVHAGSATGKNTGPAPDVTTTDEARAEPGADADATQDAAQDAAPGEDEAGAGEAEEETSEEQRWKDFRSDFVQKLTDCNTSDAIAELLDGEADQLAAYGKFDAEGRNELRELVSKQGKLIAGKGK